FVVRNLVYSKQILSAADRPVLIGVFGEVWKRLQGNRFAVYQNADEAKHGLFSLVAILDTKDPDEFLKELRQLAHFGATTGLDLSDKGAKKDDIAAVEKLIRDLGDNQYTVRESATTKLCLLGEPALPFIEKALKSPDLEVRRRAEDIKDSIVAAAAARRKELLTKDLTRPLRPHFAFAEKAETRDGPRVEIVRVR